MEEQNPQPEQVATSEVKKIPNEEHSTSTRRHKGLIIAAVIALVLGIVGVSTFIGFDSSSQYQGYIKKIEGQTKKLEINNPPSDDSGLIR